MAQRLNACIVDTHPLVWWLLEPARLSKPAMDILGHPAVTVHVPVVAVLEFQYLVEIGRISANARDVMAYIGESERFRLMPFDTAVLAASLDVMDTRDPFDRIIAASALAYGMPLITKDRWMRERFGSQARW